MYYPSNFIHKLEGQINLIWSLDPKLKNKEENEGTVFCHVGIIYG